MLSPPMYHLDSWPWRNCRPKTGSSGSAINLINLSDGSTNKNIEFCRLLWSSFTLWFACSFKGTETTKSTNVWMMVAKNCARSFSNWILGESIVYTAKSRAKNSWKRTIWERFSYADSVKWTANRIRRIQVNRRNIKDLTFTSICGAMMSTRKS